MKLRNCDLLVMAHLEQYTLIDINELSSCLKIDKSTIYLSIRNLKNLNLVSSTQDRPQKFIVNLKQLEIWKKEN